METQPTFDWMAIAEPAIAVVGALLAALLAALGRKALQFFNIKLEAADQAKLDYYTRQAALQMQEQAAAALKARLKAEAELAAPAQPARTYLPPPPKSGEEMLASAVAEVKHRMPKKSDAEIRASLEAQLPELGIGAAATLPPGKPTPAGA